MIVREVVAIEDIGLWVLIVLERPSKAKAFKVGPAGSQGGQEFGLEEGAAGKRESGESGD